MNFLPIRSAIATAAVLLLILTTSSLHADHHEGADEKKEDGKTKTAAPEKPAPLKLSGILAATRSTEISADNEKLTSLKIQKIVPHGKRVKKGDPLVWFETENLDKALRAAETDFKLAKIQRESDEFAHAAAIKKYDLDRAAAERSFAHARADYDDYLKTRVPRTIASAKNSLRSSEFSLESAAEELKQLQQMYEEDELTEQSEEIVLRRAQRSVESSQHFLEGARITYKRTMETTVPREKESQQLRWQSTQRNHEKTMLDLRLAKRREQIEFERKVRSFEEKEASMDKMRSERDRVVLTADHDGVFLHGALLRGRLPTKSPEKSAGDSVSGTTVIGTLADPSSLRLIIDLAESNLAKIRVGQSTKISPNAAASVKVNGRVAQVGAIPYANGKHNVVIAINGKLPANILPTMSASAEIDLSEKKAGKQKNAAKAKAKPAAKAKAKSAGKKAK